MFERASIMNLPTWEEGRQVLQDFAFLSDLIQKQQYSQNDKERPVVGNNEEATQGSAYQR